MRLNSRLITSFSFEDKTYDIDLAFDNVLDVFDVMDDKRLRDHEKAEICLALLLGDQEYDKAKTIDLWNFIYESFIHIESKEVIKYDLKGNPMPSKNDKKDNKVIDFEVDAERIYASFMQAYNINLFEQQGKMHWKEFQSLLGGLPSDTIMQRIIQIRQWEPSKGDSKEHKEEMEELQELYALEDDDDGEVDD